MELFVTIIKLTHLAQMSVKESKTKNFVIVGKILWKNQNIYTPSKLQELKLIWLQLESIPLTILIIQNYAIRLLQTSLFMTRNVKMEFTVLTTYVYEMSHPAQIILSFL